MICLFPLDLGDMRVVQTLGLVNCDRCFVVPKLGRHVKRNIQRDGCWSAPPHGVLKNQQ